MNIIRNGSAVKMKFTKAELAALDKATEILKTVAFVRRQEEPSDAVVELEELMVDIGQDQTILVVNNETAGA